MCRTGPIIVFGSGVAASARCLTASPPAIAITNRTARAPPPFIAELIHVRMAASCRTSQTGSKLAPTIDGRDLRGHPSGDFYSRPRSILMIAARTTAVAGLLAALFCPFCAGAPADRDE